MSQNNPSASNRDLTDTFLTFLGGLARFLIWVGVFATAIGLGFLLFNVFAVNAGTPGQTEQAMTNIHMLGKVLDAGIAALVVGLSFSFWGEETLGVLIVLGSAALYFAPALIGSSVGSLSEPAKAALGEIQISGEIGGAVGVVVVVATVIMAVRDRVKLGAKKDTLKLGKNVKAEENKLVFLGSCWQLPFCRKFIRERCPIYHSKRTCWRELTGCMCEEEIIMNAMQNKPIAKNDVAAASKMIPRNHKLTDGQKRERCKSCVIYNEHQRQKYKAAVPFTIGAFVIIYLLTRSYISADFGQLVTNMSGVMNSLTLAGSKAKVEPAPTWLSEFMTVILFVLGLSYALKILEYSIFTLKI